MSLKKLAGLFIGICFLELLFGVFGMIIAYFLITRHTRKFVIQPLSKYISANGNLPTNYVYRKMQTIRGVIWFFAIIFNIGLIYIVELVAIAIGSRYEDVSELKNKSDENNENKSYSYEDVISGRNVKISQEKKEELLNTEIIKVVKSKEIPDNEIHNKEIPKVEDKKVESSIFDKPVEDIKTSFSKEFVSKTDTVDKFDFNKPVESIYVEPINLQTTSNEKAEPKEDEISCEKCGTIMSKHKIACPKCGTLVKNTYRTGK